jgi:hypothetical protein
MLFIWKPEYYLTSSTRTSEQYYCKIVLQTKNCVQGPRFVSRSNSRFHMLREK